MMMAVVMAKVVMCSVIIICNPKIAVDHPNRQHHRVDKHVLPLAVRQECMQCGEEEHKTPQLMVHVEAQQCKAVRP